MIPQHTVYCEPFFGGGAVFFAKKPSEIEIINDKNQEVTNFYKVVKHRFAKLKKEIGATLHSRRLHQDATVVYSNPHLFDPVKRARALHVLSSQSFSANLIG